MASKDNWAIVRVWLPKTVDHSAKSVGHASLQTIMGYYSFWPDWSAFKKGAKLWLATFGSAKGIFISTPEKDDEANGRKPDVVVVLFTLKTDRIHEEFEKFKTSGRNWSLLGKNVFNIIGQSCSGLIYDLLNAGGITDMVSWDALSKMWTVSPDAMARVAVLAADSDAERQCKCGHCGAEFTLPLDLKHRVMKPDYDLNPHTWSFSYNFCQPKQVGK